MSVKAPLLQQLNLLVHQRYCGWTASSSVPDRADGFNSVTVAFAFVLLYCAIWRSVWVTIGSFIFSGPQQVPRISAHSKLDLSFSIIKTTRATDNTDNTATATDNPLIAATCLPSSALSVSGKCTFWQDGGCPLQIQPLQTNEYFSRR